jgi:hypothetical protein
VAGGGGGARGAAPIVSAPPVGAGARCDGAGRAAAHGRRHGRRRPKPHSRLRPWATDSCGSGVLRIAASGSIPPNFSFDDRRMGCK